MKKTKEQELIELIIQRWDINNITDNLITMYDTIDVERIFKRVSIKRLDSITNCIITLLNEQNSTIKIIDYTPIDFESNVCVFEVSTKK